MPHFPKPFFRASRKLWYVQLNGRQINLGSDKDEAFKKYHKLLASPEQAAATATHSDEMLVVQLFDQFLCWVEKHRAPATYGWYLPRIQSFVSAYPQLTVSELKPYHVQQWVDSMEIGQTTQRNYKSYVTKQAVGLKKFEQHRLNISTLSKSFGCSRNQSLS